MENHTKGVSCTVGLSKISKDVKVSLGVKLARTDNSALFPTKLVYFGIDYSPGFWRSPTTPYGLDLFCTMSDFGLRQSLVAEVSFDYVGLAYMLNNSGGKKEK